MDAFFVSKNIEYRCNIFIFVALSLDNIEDKLAAYIIAI